MSKIHSSVKYRLVKLPLSGERCSFYTIYLIDERTTLFDKFIEAHEAEYPDELDNILDRMQEHADRFGAREQDYRFEGSKIGEFAHAIRDLPDQVLRLYCIRYSSTLVILGSGAPKDVEAWQDDTLLEQHVRFMIQVADDIEGRMEEGDIWFINDGLDLEGSLTFNNDQDEEST